MGKQHKMMLLMEDGSGIRAEYHPATRLYISTDTGEGLFFSGKKNGYTTPFEISKQPERYKYVVMSSRGTVRSISNSRIKHVYIN
ncbi:MAG: hypothetical protein JW716_01055 [Candidatus Aenigmarchaeota archaeon]|nr:hypothetical protein [Candidatus Aenigmarchaeota archaeon]